jgi:hypothetical protein
VLTFRHDFTPSEALLRRAAHGHGYDIVASSLSIRYLDGQPEWHFVAIAHDGRQGESLASLARDLAKVEGLAHFSITPTRN